MNGYSNESKVIFFLLKMQFLSNQKIIPYVMAHLTLRLARWLMFGSSKSVIRETVWQRLCRGNHM